MPFAFAGFLRKGPHFIFSPPFQNSGPPLSPALAQSGSNKRAFLKQGRMQKHSGGMSLRRSRRQASCKRKLKKQPKETKYFEL
jgi:hypothetical protein